MLKKIVKYTIIFFIILSISVMVKRGLKEQQTLIPVSTVVTIDSNKSKYINWMYKHSNMPKEVLDTIYAETIKHSYKELLLAIMKVESNFNPMSKSSNGAVGLMQVMPKVWIKELKKQNIITTKRDLYLIADNIQAGNYILIKYLKETKKLETALYRYVGKDSKYVSKVLTTLGQLYLIQTK